jgi:hypothetical protein
MRTPRRPTVVVLGNHEDHDRVASMRTGDDCACLAHIVREQGWPRGDVVLTHHASAGQRRLGMSSRPLWLTPEVEAYCNAQRVRPRAAKDNVAPRTLAHGNWQAA